MSLFNYFSICETYCTLSMGLHPALTAARRPAEWVDKAANPAKCLAALFLILERFSLKIEMGGKPFYGFPALITL